MKKFYIVIVAALLVSLFAGCDKYSTEKITLTNVDVTESTINIKVAGDNMFHSKVLKYARTEDKEYDFTSAYRHVRNYIQSANIAVINQEAPVVETKRASGYPAFGAPDSICQTLIDTGFDVILQANNHMADKEIYGVEQTIASWKKYPQVTYLGIHDSEEDAKKIRFVECKGIKIGMLNYTYGLNRETWPLPGQEYMVDMIDDEKMQDEIRRAKKLCDLVIVFLHDGKEYVHTPTEEQKMNAHHCIDYGADLVICAHPHVIQPYEYVTTPRGNSGLVYYSLGNFFSGQEKLPTLLGGVADITLKKEVTSDNKTKITILEYGLEPVVMHSQKKEQINEVYLLRDYTDELAALTDYGKKHKDYTTETMWDLYNEVINGIKKPKEVKETKKSKR